MAIIHFFIHFVISLHSQKCLNSLLYQSKKWKAWICLFLDNFIYLVVFKQKNDNYLFNDFFKLVFWSDCTLGANDTIKYPVPPISSLDQVFKTTQYGLCFLFTSQSFSQVCGSVPQYCLQISIVVHE